MTISLTNGNHTGLFDRMGVLWGGLADILATQGGTATARVLSGASWTTRFVTADTYYTTATGAVALGTTFDGFNAAITSWKSSASGFFAQCNTLAQNTLINQANADQALSAKTPAAALALLIQQMKAGSTSINLPTVSIGAAANVGSPNGNPTIVGAVKDRFGATLLPFAETLTLTCTNDSQSGATLNQEPLSVTGQAAVTDTTSYLWPAGSSAVSSLSCVDPSQNNSANNMTYNGTFNTFTTTDYPDNWTYLVGVATTNFAKATSPVYGTTTNSLKMIGDGSTLNSFCQVFNKAASTTAGAGGTPATLKPSTVYQGNLYFQLGTGSPAAGVLEVSLVDGSNVVITDGAGSNNLVTQALTAISDTNWHALSWTFRTPAVLPTTQKLRIRFSTALSAANSCYISSVGMTAPSAVYTGGPYLSVFAGSSKLILNDAFTVAVSNNWSTSSVAQWMERVFSLRSQGLSIPMSGTPTVPDSVIA